MRTNSSTLRAALLAAGAFMFVTASANAQGYADSAYQNEGNSNVEINVPRYAPPPDKLGAPYLRYSMSQQVSYADLNLRTIRGAQALRSRVRLTARMLCTALDTRYPITAANSPPCYKTAANEAMYEADRAIARARGYAANEY